MGTAPRAALKLWALPPAVPPAHPPTSAFLKPGLLPPLSFSTRPPALESSLLTFAPAGGPVQMLRRARHRGWMSGACFEAPELFRCLIAHISHFPRRGWQLGSPMGKVRENLLLSPLGPHTGPAEVCFAGQSPPKWTGPRPREVTGSCPPTLLHSNKAHSSISTRVTPSPWGKGGWPISSLKSQQPNPLSTGTTTWGIVSDSACYLCIPAWQVPGTPHQGLWK